jgi:hypothetical protein
MWNRLLTAERRQPKAPTNVILQDFLAKNLQINIIRNSFEDYGSFKNKFKYNLSELSTICRTPS